MGHPFFQRKVKLLKPRVEILAPAGSMESMIAAINAGADAVYMGGSRFGARAYADNPQEDHFLQAIDYAHLHGCKLYMTVNTLVKESELEDLYDFLRPYYERGLDAVIVQDLGVFALIRDKFPGLPIHASTQMTVTGSRFAKQLKELGAARVVTARELSLQELAKIHEEVDIEIESFIHGALCYCYSGQCLLSSLIGGRSGNRGRCAQPCRLPYEIYKDGRKQSVSLENDGKKPKRKNMPEQKSASGQKKLTEKASRASQDGKYVLSLKDLCTLDILPDIIEAGVYSLKIEGRMKSPRYTAGVVSIYRKYTDLYLNKGRKGYRVDPADRALLLDLFDRGGLTEGYYRQHNGRDMVTLKEKPSFREVNQALFDRLDQEYVNVRKQEPIDGRLVVREGEPVYLEVSAAYLHEKGQKPQTAAAGPVVQTAQSQPMTEDKLLRQMKKTGNSPFYFASLDITLEGSCFLPVQALNELRRQALEQLEQEILAPYRRTRDKLSGSGSVSVKQNQNTDSGADRERKLKKHTEMRLHVALEEKDGLQTAAAHPEVDEIYLDACGYEAECWKDSVELCHNSNKRCALVLPHIFRREAEQYFTVHREALAGAGFDEIIVKSLEEPAFLQEQGIKLPMVFDFNLYAMNHLAASMMMQAGASRLTLPVELNSRELEELELKSFGPDEFKPDSKGAEIFKPDGCEPAEPGRQGWELIGYGCLPAMVSAQCIRRTVSGCSRKPELLMMKDRTGKLLPVKNHCRFCYNTIYNPSPLSLLGQEKLVERLAPSVLRLQFTAEKPQQIGAVIDAYAGHFRYGRDTAVPFADFTRGHLKRGVE